MQHQIKEKHRNISVWASHGSCNIHKDLYDFFCLGDHLQNFIQFLVQKWTKRLQVNI